ncbi:MAG: polyprenyl synthetase family protein [Bacteroidia bacterium]|nr:polyprenyl synthetase family protein [Bacteroidia bacterium]MDW8236235.1 polyprenyl synthetase family protein [Bacteroidia bacterium]
MSALASVSPVSLKELQAYIPEWQKFEDFYRTTLRSEIYRNNWLLEKLGEFLLRRSGKKVRPLLLLYTAKASGQINFRSILGATLIEILHNATLVHDDVVDDSDYRRGFFSLRALWGNKVAVLFGDWLLARGLLIALRHNEPQLLYYTSEAVEALTEGEFLQLKRMREASIDTQEYFTIIEKKTAALFQSTCRMGAWSAGASEEVIETAGEIGRLLGIAFQIRDDLLDWSEFRHTGKPTDADRKQKRFTLPVLWAIQHASHKVRKAILQEPFPQVKQILQDVGAFDYAEQTLSYYAERAHALAKRLPYAATLPFAELLHMLIYRSQ